MNNTNADLGRGFEWDDTIEKDTEFIVLPEGDYDFTVTKFERGRHPGSDKLPACNKAIVELTIHNPSGEDVKLNHNLFLHTKTEGMLSAFFAGIGQKKTGEKLQMNWTTVINSKGRCKLGKKVYNDNEYNEVKKFYNPNDSAEQTTQTSNFTF